MGRFSSSGILIYIYSSAQKSKKITIGNFLSLDACSGPMWERWLIYEIFAAPQSLLKEKRTRHPPIRASKRKKITDLIDLLLSTNVKNKVEVQKAPEYSVSYLCVITSNFDPSPSLCSIAGQSYDRKVWLPQLRARSGNFVFAWIIRGDLLFLWLPFFIDFLLLMEYANEIFFRQLK